MKLARLLLVLLGATLAGSAAAQCATLGSAADYALWGSNSFSLGSGGSVDGGSGSAAISGTGRAVNQNTGVRLNPSPAPTQPTLAPASFPANASTSDSSAASLPAGSWRTVTVASSTTTTIAAGSTQVHTLTVAAGATLRLHPGTYNVHTLSLGAGASVEAAAAGTVRINIGASLALADDVALNLGGSAADLQVFLYANASAGSVSAAPDRLRGAFVLYARHATNTVTLGDDLALSGALIGYSLSLGNTAAVQYTPAVQAAVAAIDTCVSPDGSSPVVPPIVPPLYLHATGFPDSSLSSSAPTTVVLGNLDNRDSEPGLLLQKGGSGENEGDGTKYQAWRGPSTAATQLSGTLELRLWAALKDNNTSKRGSLTAYLRDCDSTGAGCTLINSTTLTSTPWASSAGWVQKTLSFGAVNHTVASGRLLELKLIVDNNSEDDMWLAYDTTSYGSALGPPVPAVDHYQLTLPSSGLSCTTANVSVTACADSSSPCTLAATGLAGQTATLSASAGTLASATLTFNAAGVASTTISHAAAADGAASTVTLGGESTAATQARRCCPDGANCAAAAACSITWHTAGFLVAAAAGGAAVVPATQTAGSASATHYLRAVRTGTTSGACEAALSGARNVDWAYRCEDPGSCSAANLLSLNGGGATTVQRNDSAAALAYTSVAMTFDASGNAPFTLNFSDVGRISLWARHSVGGTTLSGGSGAFVTRPAGFSITGIRQTAAPQAVNPAAADASGARFMAAGESFTATVTATTSGGAAAPNFGRESSPEGVLLTPTLLQPSPGVAGALANGTVAGTSFTLGVATVANLSYSEVGIVSLTPSVADASYLGTGQVTGMASGAVGRFVPARFALSDTTVLHRAGRVCNPASSFGYLGENAQFTFTLTAQNNSGATTRNYADSFARLDPTAAAAWNLSGRDGATVFSTASGRLLLGSASGSWVAGVANTVSLVLQPTRAAAADGPFDAAFGVAPQDSDGVALQPLNMASSPGGANDRALLGNLALRAGRLQLHNAIGAADRTLALPVRLQHWNGSAWAVNTQDSCTTLPAAAVNFGNLRRTLTLADTAVLGDTTVSAGVGALRLAAPGGGRSGTVDVALSLGGGSADASCLQPWAPGVGDAATAGANLAYLRGAWCSATMDQDPAARASFGLPRAQHHLVHRREQF